MKVKVEFLGGLDTIVDKKRSVDLTLGPEVTTMKDLLNYISDNLITRQSDRSVFLVDGSVRPGIITLINDADWELEGKLDYVLEEGDVISFTSTLHGG